VSLKRCHWLYWHLEILAATVCLTMNIQVLLSGEGFEISQCSLRKIMVSTENRVSQLVHRGPDCIGEYIVPNGKTFVFKARVQSPFQVWQASMFAKGEVTPFSPNGAFPNLEVWGSRGNEKRGLWKQLEARKLRPQRQHLFTTPHRTTNLSPACTAQSYYSKYA
jgi:hypothetical protein